MPKQQYFKNVEKTTLRKMDLVDLAGLVGLKNQLVRGNVFVIKALTDLFEIERELRYKKEKYDARKQIMDQAEFQELQYLRKHQAQSAIQSPRNTKPILVQNFRSIISQPKKQPQTSDPRPKAKNLQIPLYRAKNQTNQNKLDRISKYIASLKRNMKLNSQTLGYKWKIKEFLLQDPNYVRLRTELERFMMREEELDEILAKAVEKGVRELIRKSEVVETGVDYKLVKVYKQKPVQSKQQKENQLYRAQSEIQLTKLTNQNKDPPFKLIQSPKTKPLTQQSSQQDLSYQSPKLKKQSSPSSEFISVSFNSPLRKLSSKIDIQSKAEQDFNLIKKQLQKSNQSYIEMLSKINQTVEKGSEKLIQLREKRKKKFQKDDDVWDQLDKI